MEKIGMYNRQGILTRRDKRIVDKNHTFKPVQEHREITKATYVKDRINSKVTNKSRRFYFLRKDLVKLTMLL